MFEQNQHSTKVNTRSRSTSSTGNHDNINQKPTTTNIQNSKRNSGRRNNHQPDSSTNSSSSSGSEFDDSEVEDQNDGEQSDSSSDVFVLHRHLELRHLNNQTHQSIDSSGFDIFSSQQWNLDKKRLKRFNTLRDTDLVQIHHPVPVKSNSWSTGKLKQKDLSLLDISSPPVIINGGEKPSTTNKTSHSNNLADLNQITTDVNQKPSHQLLKRISNSLSGPSVSSLYYSPYSSFAPSYDTTGTVQTADQARLKYLSRRRLDDWCKRDGIYDLIDDSEVVLILPENNQGEKKDNELMEAEVVNRSRRKRQRTRSEAFKDNTEKTHNDQASNNLGDNRAEINQSINCLLKQNARLIKNLQERQFQRLRSSNDNSHLDPILSASAATPVMSNLLNQAVPAKRSGSSPGVITKEEAQEAKLLMRSLYKLISQRPRLMIQSDNTLTQKDLIPKGSLGAESFELTLIPDGRSIRNLYKMMLMEPLEDDEGEECYDGDLPPNEPVGILESVLNSQPDQRVTDLLKRVIAENESNFSESSSSINNGRQIRGVGLSKVNNPIGQQQTNQRRMAQLSSASPFRDPSLSGGNSNLNPTINKINHQALTAIPSMKGNLADQFGRPKTAALNNSLNSMTMISKFPQQQRMIGGGSISNLSLMGQPSGQGTFINLQQQQQKARFIGSPFSSRESVVNGSLVGGGSRSLGSSLVGLGSANLKVGSSGSNISDNVRNVNGLHQQRQL
ncbi:expressed protein [Phakopsora pachyrhizi]|uniref:Expressed protein n=1 Tax=Phakopsora pachyrhizi TaxID=170000 RepID=A0AAV0AQM3_PHAPC|nr:expressed protein [Phakopsora pachyrhizi]